MAGLAWASLSQLTPLCGPAPRAGDVTHAVGVTLGHGWYAQPLVDAGPRSLLFRLAVETVNADGSPAGTVDVISDTSWVQSGGPIVYDDIYGGETYDARLETPGWTTAGFDASQYVRS